MRTFVIALAASIIFVSMSNPGDAAENPRTAPGPEKAMLAQVTWAQRLEEQIPTGLSFTDEKGSRVELKRFLGGGRPAILVLAYYDCPMLCTLVLNGLLDAVNGMELVPGKDYEIVVVSIDHRENYPLAFRKKAAYVAKTKFENAGNGWHFLVGDEASIRKLADSIGYSYAYDEVGDQFAHPAGLTVLTSSGRISRYLFGSNFDPRDLRFALMESSAERIGTRVDQVLLRCYRYDPSTGKYTPAIASLLRYAGSLTVLTIAAFVGFALRRDRADSSGKGRS